MLVSEVGQQRVVCLERLFDIPFILIANIINNPPTKFLDLHLIGELIIEEF